MLRMTVDPTDRVSRPITVANVAHDLPAQITHRPENAAGDQVALHLREPKFNLVEPGRVSWGEMQVHVGVRRQELRDPFGLVRREVIQDDVTSIRTLCSRPCVTGPA
jgi:hypothetical protein